MKRTLVLLLVMVLALPAAAQTDAPAPADELQSFTAAFVGDVLIHSTVWVSASRHGSPFDFRPMFSPTRHVIAGADLAICHLENPLSPNSTNLSGFPRFNAPRETAYGLVYAGFDGCTTASNHSNDMGPEGIANTIEVMGEAGLVQAGMRTTPGDSLVAFYEVGEATVANISATFSLNGISLPVGRGYMVQMLDVDQILQEAADAKAAGADLVVTSIHCCVEYRTMPTDSQRSMSHRLINSPDIDLVVSHHSHVVGPVEWVEGKPVLHGLGNFLSNQSARAGLPAHTQDGVIAVVTAREYEEGWRFDEVEVVPTWVDEPSQGHVIRMAAEGSVPYQRTMDAINMMNAEVGIFSLTPLPRSILSRLD